MLAQDENKDETILKALQKAFIWQEKLDNGTYDTVQECSEQEGVEITHMYRILRLTYLAPEIVEAITLGTQPRTLTLQNIIRGFPLLWQEQKQQFGFV